MEKLHFTAKGIFNEMDEEEILCVGFFNEEEEHYLMIQFEEEYDEQNVEQGMNTYHIERDDQSYGEYGGVKQIILTPRQCRVIPDERGKKHLDCTEILIDFQINEAEFSQLKESLQHIFKEAFVLES